VFSVFLCSPLHEFLLLWSLTLASKKKKQLRLTIINIADFAIFTAPFVTQMAIIKHNHLVSLNVTKLTIQYCANRPFFAVCPVEMCEMAQKEAAKKQGFAFWQPEIGRLSNCESSYKLAIPSRAARSST
jgi:hypothetical protein